MNFYNFWEDLKESLEVLVKESVANFGEQAKQDGLEFLDQTKEDLEKWAKQLAAGDLSKDDFEWLVNGRKDLAKMEALKQAGLAAIEIDKLKKQIIDLVIGKAFDHFL